jgi:rod shape determining protein RodA
VAAVFALVAALPAAWVFLLDDDKRRRILSVYDPSFDPLGTGWQQSLAMTAIGSGLIWGKGIWTGAHQYIPEIYNDFIFAFAGEALGLRQCGHIGAFGRF